jgi:hypothetical protein
LPIRTLSNWRVRMSPDCSPICDLGGVFDSLSLAMGLTTILTTIWVRPPKYIYVQNPYKQMWSHLPSAHNVFRGDVSTALIKYLLGMDQL